MRRRCTTRAAVALLLLASGCSSEPRNNAADESSSSTGAVLSAAATRSSVIPLQGLGPGFKVDDDAKQGPDNCIRPLGRFDELNFPKDHQSDIQYLADSSIGVPSVLSAVGSMPSVAQAAALMKKFRRLARACHAVDITSPQGLHIRMQVTADDDGASPGATAQINLVGIGTGTLRGVDVPYTVRVSLIQVGNNLASVGFSTIASDGRADAEKLTRSATDRLRAVIAGESPTDEPLNLHVVTSDDIRRSLPSTQT